MMEWTNAPTFLRGATREMSRLGISRYGWDNKLNKLQNVRDLFPTVDGRNQVEVDTTLVYDQCYWQSDIPTDQGIWTYRYARDTRDLAGIEINRATADYSHDAEHRVSANQYVVNDEAPRAFGYAYDPLGRSSQATFANGMTATYCCDAASHLTGITYKRADGSVFGDLDVWLRPAGSPLESRGQPCKGQLAASSERRAIQRGELTYALAKRCRTI